MIHRIRSQMMAAGVVLLSAQLLSCQASSLSGSASKKNNSKAEAEAAAAAAAAASGSGGTDGNGNGPGGGSGTDLGGNGPGNGTDVNAANPSCTQGCCPSRKTAFVDCSGQAGAKAATVNRGPFNMTAVACSALAKPGSLSGYDTIVYYGPTNRGQAQGLPAAIEGMLNAGAKVIAFPTPEFGLFDHAFYGLTLETATEFLSTVGTATISVTNQNAMSKAFDKARYSSSTFGYLMFLGPFLLVDRSTFTPELQAHWCSDLTARSPLVIQMTSFHGMLFDNGPRKGLLVATTVSMAGGAGNFDFNEPFLAAHLSQRWNRAGNSMACGLPCAPGPDGGAFTHPTGVGKPVIYLYPTKTQDIDVKLDFAGDLVTTYPKYNPSRKGWRVRAQPSGQLINADDQQEYSYIYWNGTTKALQPSFDEGFVVKGEDTRKFLQSTLAQLGLNAREANDMIVYWLPYMERHKYNVISFAHRAYTDIARLTIQPKPDALLRVFMQFKGVDEPVAIKPQKLDRFERQGFTVVEWGGTEVDGDWHVVQ